MKTKAIQAVQNRLNHMFEEYEKEQATLKEFLDFHKVKFREFVRKEVIELSKSGLSGDFNKEYKFVYEEGDNIRINWKWNHTVGETYFCRFFAKKQRKEDETLLAWRFKESLCFVKPINISAFIEQVNRDITIQQILKP